VKSYDLLELASRNLREAILRNSLTTLGISVGVASLVAMLSLGTGLQQLFSSKLGRSGLFDTIIVTSTDFGAQGGGRRAPRNSVSVGSSGAAGTASAADAKKPAKLLDEPARANLGKMEHVREVYPQISVAGQYLFDNPLAKPAPPPVKDSKDASSTSVMDDNLHFGTITGLPASTRVSEAFDDLQGGFFSSNNADECIIMAEFARELLDVTETEDKASPNGGKVSLRSRELSQKLPQDQLNALVGHELTWRYAERVDNAPAADAKKKPFNPAEAALSGGNPMDMMSAMAGFNIVRREKKLKIVGVVVNDPSSGFRMGPRGRVYIPQGLAESLNVIQPSDVRALMRGGKEKNYPALVVKVDSAKNVPAVQDAIKKEGFNTFSIQDASKAIGYIFAFVDMFLGMFGSLALAVASLGIVNTLVMAILERRREIGVMKAVGASDNDVKLLFFVEAGCMGVVGGVFGVVLGWLIGKIINFGINIYLERQDIPTQTFFAVPFWLVASAIGFSVVVSLISGLYPAARAAKLDPVQALRHD